MEGNGPPLLSLKVMRVSRPSLASQWQPFFSSSPSLSTHATANLLSLQGTHPLPGHPKTLRDLTHAGQILTMPESFGAIHLGETFSCVLCVNNDSLLDVHGVTVKVEMQTATNKVSLAEVGGVDHVMTPSSVLEAVVCHEVKELGQHVLACTVSYQIPPPPGVLPNSSQDQVQSFRKFYKFAVSNPLSVKTKVHTSSSPTAVLSIVEREKVFLEVQIQSLMQAPLWVERIRLIPVDGWAVESEEHGGPSTLAGYTENTFGGSMAIMHPQDVRQYIYVLSPLHSPNEPQCVQPTLPPGTIIPLGRLDVVWRSSMGEPGRLVTSPLTRRLPVVPPPPAQGSAVPTTAYRPRTQPSGVGSGPPSRSQSPHPSLQLRSYTHPSVQRVASPPPRPSSPLRRDSTITLPGSPKALSQSIITDPVRETAMQDVKGLSINTDLTVTSTLKNAQAALGEPFDIKFELIVAGSLPQQAQQISELGKPIRRRLVRLAIQHVLPPKTANVPAVPSGIDNVVLEDAFTSMIGSALRSGQQTPRSTDVQSLHSPISTGGSSTTTLVGLPSRIATLRHRQLAGQELRISTASPIQRDNGSTLPSPYANSLSRKERPEVSGRITPVGSSLLILPPLHLRPHTHLHPTIPGAGTATSPPDQAVTHGAARAEFSLTYVPTACGFAEVGGLRVLLVGDWEEEGEDDKGVDEDLGETRHLGNRILRVWDVVAEVWVK